MDFHYELLEETRKEIKNMWFFNEAVEINEEEYDIEFTIKDYDAKEEIRSEIELCVQSRFICGKENVFFESLFKAYKLGGWPCGWKNGKIIVYTRQ